MSAIGYYLLICQCDRCDGDEQVFRGMDKNDAWRKARKRYWKYVNGELLCIRCAPATVCQYCNGVGCLACQGEKTKARQRAGMRIVK